MLSHFLFFGLTSMNMEDKSTFKNSVLFNLKLILYAVVFSRFLKRFLEYHQSLQTSMSQDSLFSATRNMTTSQLEN